MLIYTLRRFQPSDLIVAVAVCYQIGAQPLQVALYDNQFFEVDESALVIGEVFCYDGFRHGFSPYQKSCVQGRWAASTACWPGLVKCLVRQNNCTLLNYRVRCWTVHLGSIVD